jgi:hypothetical protein
MNVVWWLIFSVAVVWQLRHSLRTASRRIDSDIAAFSRQHPRADNAELVLMAHPVTVARSRAHSDRNVLG